MADEGSKCDFSEVERRLVSRRELSGEEPVSSWSRTLRMIVHMQLKSLIIVVGAMEA
jgi:hypothetical protein